MSTMRQRDEFAFLLRGWMDKWRKPATSLCIGALIGTIINILTGDNAVTIRFIYERMTNTSLPLFYFLLVIVFLMLFFWAGELGIGYYCKSRRWELLLANLAKERTGRSIAQFSSSVITWGENLTLQLCPDLQFGWKIDSIELRWVKGAHEFGLPNTDKGTYETFRNNNRDKRWYSIDNVASRLVKNPVSFTDSPELILEVQKCKYSEVQYTNHFIATDHNRRQDCLQSVVKGNIPFANVFVIQAVVVTNDDSILATLSSMKKDYFGGCWSFSIEEQLRAEDLDDTNVHNRVSTWMKRALSEELGVTESDYFTDNIRALSVFIEGHNLNCGLCCLVRLSIDSATLSAIISAKPRQDTEFTEFKFCSLDEAVELLRHPNIPLHPTSEYRLFVALSHLLTPPRLARKLFHQEKH